MLVHYNCFRTIWSKSWFNFFQVVIFLVGILLAIIFNLLVCPFPIDTAFCSAFTRTTWITWKMTASAVWCETIAEIIKCTSEIYKIYILRLNIFLILENYAWKLFTYIALNHRKVKNCSFSCYEAEVALVIRSVYWVLFWNDRGRIHSETRQLLCRVALNCCRSWRWNLLVELVGDLKFF